MSNRNETIWQQPISRRHALRVASLAIAAPALVTCNDRIMAATGAPNAIAPEQALARLVAGNLRYAANTPANKDFLADRASRVAAQYPIAAILSCADSRVAPELAFDQGPGDLFVVRVAGNFVSEEGLASLEYGIMYLGIPLVVVLGHTHCGAVGATVNAIQRGAVFPGHLGQLTRAIKPAVALAQPRGEDNLVANATIENVRLNVNRLSVSRPIIGPYVEKGKVKVVGALYDLATGTVNLV